MDLKLSNPRETLTGFLYRLYKNKPDKALVDQEGKLEFKVNQSKISVQEDGGITLAAEFSAYLHTSIFLLEIEGLVAFDVDGVLVEDSEEVDGLLLKVKEMIKRQETDLFQEPISKLVTHLLKITPTRLT